MKIEKESPFLLEELFFSRTNTKGHIHSGNEVFQRISGYAWTELLSRPHNVIRHPDMPRGVFHFLWENLLTGRPVGAYVKNKTKDGNFYWVYALALPVGNGFLSIRLKPSAGILDTVSAVYEELRSQEKIITPEESQDELLRKISTLGFASYQDFMTHSLIAELHSRFYELKDDSYIDLNKLLELNTLNKSICTIPEQILSSYQSIIWTPLNLEISALKLGDIGRSVGVVASNYQKMIGEIEREMQKFREASHKVEIEIKEATFLKATNFLISEVMAVFQQEEKNEFIHVDDELKHLVCLRDVYLEKTMNTFLKVHEALKDFIEICKSLSSLIIGLEVIRITGRMEISRLNSCSEFNGLFDELIRFQRGVSENLGNLQGLLARASDSLDSFMEKNFR